MTAALWILLGYLVGSCPTGYLVVRLIRGEDIRNFGSGNIGATNVGRVMGKPWSVAVAIFDMVKGGLMILAAWILGVREPWILSLTGVAGVLGHNFPVWLGFKGGKGVATSFGAVALFDFFDPWPALLGGLVWYGTMKGSRYVSLASMVSLSAVPIFLAFFGADRAYVITAAGLALLTILRHRANIGRLLAGTESRVGTPKVS
jgi:glycerol-3-phosphate acyltransferase PlsY